MTTKHTPGPWVQHPGAPKNAAVIARELPNHRRTVVGVIPSHLEFGNAAVTDWAEQEANARLIAAAPEMLAALERVLQAMTRVELSDSSLQEWRAAKAAVRAAIAKAS